MQPFFCASLPNATGEFNAKGKDVDSVNAGSHGRGLLTSSSRDAFLRSTRRQLLQDFKAEIGTQQTSANIAMTAVRPLAIVVDEDEESAWIDAGIKIVDVLDYLGNYVTKTAPRGWTLATFPAFLFTSRLAALWQPGRMEVAWNMALCPTRSWPCESCWQMARWQKFLRNPIRF